MNLGTVGVELMTARMAWNKCDVLEHERTETKVLAAAPPPPPPILDEDGTERAVSLPSTERKGFGLYFSSDACLGQYHRSQHPPRLPPP